MHDSACGCFDWQQVRILCVYIMCFRRCVCACAMGPVNKIQKKQKSIFNIYLWHKIQRRICKPRSNCYTNILLKSRMALMMTKLWNSAVFFFVALSCTPLSETLELSNKQDRRGGSPSLEFSALRVILHAGLVWLCECGSRCGGRTVEGPSPALPALLPTC